MSAGIRLYVDHFALLIDQAVLHLAGQAVHHDLVSAEVDSPITHHRYQQSIFFVRVRHGRRVIYFGHVHAELKRGLGGLATIGSTAPFVGLFGTVMGILNAFKEISTQKATGLGAVAGGISEALVTTAFGLLVAIPAVMMFNYLTGRVEAFDVEMDNSSSELIDYFLKRREVRRT